MNLIDRIMLKVENLERIALSDKNRNRLKVVIVNLKLFEIKKI